jgi:hypothetical protein
MGTAGQPMHQSNAECGVAVIVPVTSTRVRMRRLASMHMDVHMTSVIRQVFVRVNLVLKGTAKAPNANPNQHHAN